MNSSNFQVKKKKRLLQICVCAVKIYLKAWIEAPIPASAPNNDFKLLKSIQANANINSAVYKAVLCKFCSHLWYLSKELVAFAFSDTTVLVNTKRLMVQATKENNKTEDASKPQIIHSAMFYHIELSDLVTTGSLLLFQKLGVSSSET